MKTKNEYEAPTLQTVGSASQVIQGYDAAGSDYLDEFLIEGGPFLADQEQPRQSDLSRSPGKH
jgi:hypothetical protein